MTDRAAARRRVDAAWESFLDGGEPQGVAPEIVRSWRRVRDTFRVDLALRRAPRLAPDDLARRLEHDDVLDAAMPALAELTSRLRAERCVIAYLDAEGWILTVAGDPEIAELAAEANFAPGGGWQERVVGTTAAGVALAEGRPVEVFATEHPVRAWQGWACAGAPVFAPDLSEPVGVIDIAAPWDVADRASLLASAAIAGVVQERLRAVHAVRDEVVRHALRAARASGDALVAVDGRGRLVSANEAGRRRLSDASALPLEFAERIGALLHGGEAPSEEELVVEWSAGVPGEERRRIHCAPVLHLGRAVGAVLRFPPPARRTPVKTRGGPASRYDLEDILGDSERLRGAVDLARIAARNDLPVVLQGESGTGKELFAHAIHAQSARADGPFIAVNCGAIPAPLVEAELFGYEAGSFTGANREGRAGKLEEAHGGTLFLDEVGELPPPAQTALLRVLQESEVIRIGGVAPRRVDVRVIAATNRNLAGEVGAGRFRHDLFFRLDVLSVVIPPLRDRRGDLPLLARAFLDEAEAKIGREGLELSEGALERLAAHPWPGNVRELKNAMLRAAATARGATIEASDLLLAEFVAPPPPPAAVATPAPPPPGERPARTVDDGAGDGAHEAGPDRDELVAALDRCGWNIARAATTLGVSRMTLYRRLRKFGITR